MTPDSGVIDPAENSKLEYYQFSRRIRRQMLNGFRPLIMTLDGVDLCNKNRGSKSSVCAF
jgi:hypothetical protein